MAEITPVSFAEMNRRLVALGVEQNEYDDTIVYHKLGFRMGLGTSQFYTVAYHGGDGVVYASTLRKLLESLDIHEDDWQEAGQAQPPAPDAQADTVG